MSLRYKIPKKPPADISTKESILNPFLPTPGPPTRPPHHLSKNPEDVNKRPLVKFPFNESLTQPVFLPAQTSRGLGSFGVVEKTGYGAEEGTAASDINTQDELEAPFGAEPLFFPITSSNLESEGSKHKEKRERQRQRWVNDVIPTLIQPYLELLRRTENLRYPSTAQKNKVLCSCELKRRHTVICIRFDSTKLR